MVNMMESSLAETMVSSSHIIITIRETIRWQEKPTLGVVKCWYSAGNYTRPVRRA